MSILGARKEDTQMLVIILMAILALTLMGVFIYLLVLVIKALRRYIHSKPVRHEKAKSARALGEVIKTHRMSCNMTQEFVAQSVIISDNILSGSPDIR